MNYISLFSGIEAATVAWKQLGWKPIAFSEIEKFPCEILKHHYPNVPNLGDITKIDWSEYSGTIDVLVGGSPCQSFSLAGDRTSLDGESRLMFEFIRAVRDIKPKWFLWENVPGALSAKGLHGEIGGAFRCLLREMDELGYGQSWRVLDAQFFGVAQRRRRLFLVGRSGGRAGSSSAVLFEQEMLQWDTRKSNEKRKEITEAARRSIKESKSLEEKNIVCMSYTTSNASIHRNKCGTLNVGGDKPIIAFSKTQITSKQNGSNPKQGDHFHTLCSGDSAPCIAIAGNIIGRKHTNGGNGIGCQEELSYTLTATDTHGVESNTVVRRLTPIECERLQGFPDNYTKLDESTKNAQRYKALGNSFSVPVIRWIGERIEKVSRIEIMINDVKSVNEGKIYGD